MRVAVTGGSGQLGTLVLRRLIDDRSVKSIVSIDVRPPTLMSGKLESVTCDVRDRAVVGHLERCDALVHLAFIVARHLPESESFGINVDGSKNVFGAAAQAGVRRIIYASSVAAYGILPGHPVPITEQTPRRLQENFFYAKHKYLVEEFLDQFERERPEISIARMRPAVLIGARMEHALGKSLRARVIPAMSDAPLPIVWDEDVADAFVLALKQAAHGAFILTAAEPLSASALARAAGMRSVRIPRGMMEGIARLTVTLEHMGLGEALDPEWVAQTTIAMAPSSERALRELGWKPRCKTAADVVRRYDEVVPVRLDPRLAIFFRGVMLAAKRANANSEVDMRGVDADIHVALTGPRGGDFTIRVHGGAVTVAPGVPRPPTGVITVAARLFLDLLSGKTDFGAAQLTGKIRIEGDPIGAMMVRGMIASFRSGLETNGARGAFTKAMVRWAKYDSPLGVLTQENPS